MKPSTYLKSALATAVIGLAFAGGANAAVVVTNGSFELGPTLASGSRSYFLDAGTPANWTQYNGAGTGNGYVQNYSAAQLTSEYGGNPLPSGNYTLGLGRGGAASVIQTLGTVVTGESYTLSGYLGRPATEGVNPTGGYIMELYLGATSGALTTPIMTLNNASVTDPTAGTWKSWSGTSSVITSGQNGQYLTVRLYADTGAWPSMREFDNISIATIPEPTTWALLAGSLTTVMVLRRRRK